MKHVAIVLCWPIALLCLVGCSTPRIDLSMASQPNVNPDNSGRPSPVIVKTFELRTDLNFKQNDFQSLFERPVQTLGAELIAADEMVLIPGEARKIAYYPNAETRFLGVVAGFRYLERAQWRVIKPIKAETKNLIALELNGDSILIIPDDKAASWVPEEAVTKFQQQMPQQKSQDSSQVPPAGGNDTSTNISTTGNTKSLNVPTEKESFIPNIEVSPAPQEGSLASPPVRTMSQIK